MVMVRLLISEGSWLVFRIAENATRPVPDLTDIPRALPDGSTVGVESHTTRHFPSNTIGSVSFWPLTSEGAQRTRISSPRRKTERGARYGEERHGQNIISNEDKLCGGFFGFVGCFAPSTMTIRPLKVFNKNLSSWRTPHFINRIITSPGPNTSTKDFSWVR